jgi:transposase
LEANAALRSIVRRDTGESYKEFLTRLAQASGIETPTRAELARLDRERPKKGSNDDWQHPQDPDARITKMKDGRTHLAHKAEHAIDMETGAVVAVTVQPADRGDPTSLEETIAEAMDTLADVSEDDQAADGLGNEVLSELVADKGYHSNAVLTGRQELGIRTYISEPDRGRRRWRHKLAEQRATYANRRRIRGERGKRLLRRRGELLERSFAHCYDTGGMRRVHLRGRLNIASALPVG